MKRSAALFNFNFSGGVVKKKVIGLSGEEDGKDKEDGVSIDVEKEPESTTASGSASQSSVKRVFFFNLMSIHYEVI